MMLACYHNCPVAGLSSAVVIDELVGLPEPGLLCCDAAGPGCGSDETKTNIHCGSGQAILAVEHRYN